MIAFEPTNCARDSGVPRLRVSASGDLLDISGVDSGTVERIREPIRHDPFPHSFSSPSCRAKRNQRRKKLRTPGSHGLVLASQGGVASERTPPPIRSRGRAVHSTPLFSADRDVTLLRFLAERGHLQRAGDPVIGDSPPSFMLLKLPIRQPLPRLLRPAPGGRRHSIALPN